MDDSSDHNSSATMPASWPYVSPNDVLIEKKRRSPAVATTQPIAAMLAPNASQESDGWCRRGHERNTTVIANVTRITAAGHRAIPQARFAAPLWIEPPFVSPKGRSEKARSASVPAVT